MSEGPARSEGASAGPSSGRRDLPESLAPPPGTLLQKPFTPEVLAARVAEVLAR